MGSANDILDGLPNGVKFVCDEYGAHYICDDEAAEKSLLDYIKKSVFLKSGCVNRFAVQTKDHVCHLLKMNGNDNPPVHVRLFEKLYSGFLEAGIASLVAAIIALIAKFEFAPLILLASLVAGGIGVLLYYIYTKMS
jgi:hypothetical protein